MLKLQLLHHQLRQSIQSHYTLLQFFTFHFIANRFSSSVHRRSWHGPPPFSNFLFTNLFSIKFLYFFIISSLFPYFNLFVDQYSYNLMLTSNCMCRPYIDTNNPQGNSSGLKIVPLLASSTFIAPYFHNVIQTRTCIHS